MFKRISQLLSLLLGLGLIMAFTGRFGWYQKRVIEPVVKVGTGVYQNHIAPKPPTFVQRTAKQASDKLSDFVASGVVYGCMLVALVVVVWKFWPKKLIIVR